MYEVLTTRVYMIIDVFCFYRFAAYGTIDHVDVHELKRREISDMCKTKSYEETHLRVSWVTRSIGHARRFQAV